MKSSIAYPNASDVPLKPIYDLNKWLSSLRDIHFKTHLGAPRQDAINQTTKDWNAVERKSFLNWMRYYESGEQFKYKTAQLAYYVNDSIPNYFVPNPKSPPSPILNVNQEVQDAKEAPGPSKEEQENEKRRVVEDLRRKILGRLNSAEKLLSSHDGQIFAGPDFERLLVAIYELKKQIQTVNKISLSAQTCIDLIVRQANMLKHQGFNTASTFMVKLAQTAPGDFNLNLNEIPAGGSNEQTGGPLTNNTPSPEGLSAADPTAEIPTDPTIEDNKEGPKDGIQGFLDNMEGTGFTLDDIAETDDTNETEDEVIIDDDEAIMDQVIASGNSGELVVEAQAIPDSTPAAPEAAPAPDPKVQKEKVNETKRPLDMTPEQVKQGPDVSGVKTDLDALIDSAFSNITVNDIISKLESVNRIFKTREISRQLALVDIMLHKLNLAEFFPELSEAINKNLDSNSYSMVRIETMLSKLRGSTSSENVDLTNQNPSPTSPEAQSMRQSLENTEKKDQQRKELRQQMQDKKLEENLRPEPSVVNPQEELAAAPAKIEPNQAQPTV